MDPLNTKTFSTPVVIAFLAAAVSNAYSASYLQLMRTAKDAKAKQNWEQAAREFERAADRSGNQLKKSEAMLLSGLAWQAWGQKAPKQSPKILPLAEKAYSFVLQQGNPSDRLIAGNNLGTLLIENRQYERALNVLNQVNYRHDPDAFVFDYNRARAMEGLGQVSNAFNLHLQILRSNPEFEPARTRALRLATRSDSGSASSCAQLIHATLDIGLIDAAASQIIAGLRNWSHSKPLASAIVKYVNLAGIQSEDLVTVTNPVLRVMYDGNSWLRGTNGLLGSLNRALDGGRLLSLRHPKFFGADQVNERLSIVLSELKLAEHVSPNPNEQDELRKEFAQLLVSVADRTLGQISPEPRKGQEDKKSNLTREQVLALRQAATLYCGAWTLDNQNLDAAGRFVELLREHVPQIDPKRLIFKSLMEEIFRQKNSLYSESQYHTLNLEQKIGLYYLHWLLGDILSKGDQRDLRIYQPDYHYRRALDLEAIIRAEDESFRSYKEELEKSLDAVD